MLVKKLIEKMSEIIIETLDTKGHAGHASRINNFGHFSPKMFSPSMFFRCKPETSVRMAMNLLELVHLERYPNTDSRPTAKDFRWRKRFEAWNRVSRYRNLYLENSINEDDVINQAKDKGFWSVWFTVFAGIDAILSRLISEFPGTCSNCFDEHNHYVPIERNHGKEDPV